MGGPNGASPCYGNLEYKGFELIICTMTCLLVDTLVAGAHQEDPSGSKPSEQLSNSVSLSNSE